MGALHSEKCRFSTGPFSYRSALALEESLRTITNIKSHIIADIFNAGPDINAQNDAGKTPMHVAVANAMQNEPPELHPYVATSLQMMISTPGLGLDLKDKKQRTPLMLGIGKSSLFVTRMLLEVGASREDLDGPDLENHKAVHGKSVTLLRLFIRHFTLEDPWLWTSGTFNPRSWPSEDY